MKRVWRWIPIAFMLGVMPAANVPWAAVTTGTHDVNMNGRINGTFMRGDAVSTYSLDWDEDGYCETFTINHRTGVDGSFLSWGRSETWIDEDKDGSPDRYCISDIGFRGTVTELWMRDPSSPTGYLYSKVDHLANLELKAAAPALESRGLVDVKTCSPPRPWVRNGSMPTRLAFANKHWIKWDHERPLEARFWYDQEKVSEEILLERFTSFGQPISATMWTYRIDDESRRQLSKRIDWTKALAGPRVVYIKRSVTLATLLHLPPSWRGAVPWRRSNLDPAVDKARIASSPKNGSSQ